MLFALGMGVLAARRMSLGRRSAPLRPVGSTGDRPRVRRARCRGRRGGSDRPASRPARRAPTTRERQLAGAELDRQTLDLPPVTTGRASSAPRRVPNGAGRPTGTEVAIGAERLGATGFYPNLMLLTTPFQPASATAPAGEAGCGRTSAAVDGRARDAAGDGATRTLMKRIAWRLRRARGKKRQIVLASRSAAPPVRRPGL
jgi:hypothetical protein